MDAEHAADVGEIGVVPHQQSQLGSGWLADIGAAIDGAPHRHVRGIAVRTRHVAFRHRGVAARRTHVAVGRGAVAVKSTAVERPARPWVPQPYYGGVFDGVTLGAVIAATAVPTSRSIDVCWYWSNSSQTRGYWDFCQ